MTKGERIKQLRENHDMTQTDLAKKLDIATQTVFKYEKNIVTNIPLITIEKIAAIFDVTPAYIMGWDEPNAQDKVTISQYNTLLSNLTPHETKVITAYRDKPEMQPAVDTLLGITVDKDEYIPVAARNGKSGMVKVTSSPEERKAALDKVLPGVSIPKKPDVF